MSNSGQPGAGGTIRLRGTNSITQSNAPIVYVDGVRIYSDPGPLTPNARQSTLAINDIKPDDIERIEVVKGAAATTLYGTEASGGVIQIFTKTGTAGQRNWNLDLTGGQNFMGHVGPSSDPTGLFLNQCSGANLHDAFNNVFVDPTCPSSGTWLQRGDVSRLSLSVRGGGDAMTYFLSANANNENGVVRTNGQKDGGVRGNFSFNAARNLSIGVNTSYNRKNINWLPDGNLANGFTLNVMRGPNNNFKGGKGECANVPTTTICVTNGYVLDLTSTNNADHFILGGVLQWSPISALTNRFNVGFDYNNNDIRSIIPFGFLNLAAGSINNSNWNHTKLSLDYAGSYQNAVRSSTIASTFSWGGQLFEDREHFTGVSGQSFSGPGDPTLASAATITLGPRRPAARHQRWLLSPGAHRLARPAVHHGWSSRRREFSIWLEFRAPAIPEDQRGLRALGRELLADEHLSDVQASRGDRRVRQGAGRVRRGAHVGSRRGRRGQAGRDCRAGGRLDARPGADTRSGAGIRRQRSERPRLARSDGVPHSHARHAHRRNAASVGRLLALATRERGHDPKRGHRVPAQCRASAIEQSRGEHARERDVDAQQSSERRPHDDRHGPRQLRSRLLWSELPADAGAGDLRCVVTNP